MNNRNLGMTKFANIFYPEPLAKQVSAVAILVSSIAWNFVRLVMRNTIFKRTNFKARYNRLATNPRHEA